MYTVNLRYKRLLYKKLSTRIHGSKLDFFPGIPNFKKVKFLMKTWYPAVKIWYPESHFGVLGIQVISSPGISKFTKCADVLPLDFLSHILGYKQHFYKQQSVISDKLGDPFEQKYYNFLQL